MYNILTVTTFVLLKLKTTSKVETWMYRNVLSSEIFIIVHNFYIYTYYAKSNITMRRRTHTQAYTDGTFFSLSTFCSTTSWKLTFVQDF